MSFRTITDVQTALKQKEVSAVEIVQASLARTKEIDPHLGAFLRSRDQVIAEAEAVDARLAKTGKLLPLDGVTVAVKDNMGLAGEEVTAASKILQGYQAVDTATAVKKLQAHGALVVGKTNLDEFAMGASTENSAYKITKNPWNTALVPGGSSGGSAVAVSSDQALIALGSDTGGSIRQPASFTNVVGFKPTYGRVSRYGLLALASSLDQIGPFAHTVEDAAVIYEALAGQDANDATTSARAVDSVTTTMRQPVKNMRIGIPKEFFGEGVDDAVTKVIMECIEEYRQLGATIVDVSVPHARDALAAYYIIQPAEASSNLARYDGIRYGLSVRKGKGLSSIYRQTRDVGFGAEVKRRIMIGTFVLSAGYADAFYHQANRVRAMLREEFDRVFDQVDVLLTPTSPTTAFPIGARTADPLTMYMADLLTVPANLANIPAMSLPGGFANGLPVGLQLMAREWDEVSLFRAGFAYQQVTDWHLQNPPEMR